MMNRSERDEHLFKVITSQRFLKKQGLGNEVPFFICAFDPKDGLTLNQDRKNLITRLNHERIEILDINLYELSIKMMRDRGIFEQVIDMESQISKDELKEVLQGILDPQDHLIPEIAKCIHNINHDVIFLSGIGEVYPFLRSHTILNNLQSTANDRPTIMFFPGEYTHALATGASLDLFGLLHDDKYYRAFNIMNYEV